MPAAILAEVALTFTLVAIDTALGPTDGNTTMVYTNAVINGVEVPTWAEQNMVTGVSTAAPRWGAISADMFNQLSSFIDSWGRYRMTSMGLISNAPGPSKKRLGELTMLFKVMHDDTTLPPTESNTTILETRVLINGVLFPTWAQQITSPANSTEPKWVATTLAARNEERSFTAAWLPDWLLAQGVLVP